MGEMQAHLILKGLIPEKLKEEEDDKSKIKKQRPERYWEKNTKK